MPKRIPITIVAIIVTYSLAAQRDCVAWFRYKGVISSDSIRFRQIGVPTTYLLDSFVKESDVGAFAIFDIKDSVFNVGLTTDMSSEFCRSGDDIIADFFKKKNAYKVRLLQKSNGNISEVTISVESIKFNVELIDNKKQIVIDLGRIKL